MARMRAAAAPFMLVAALVSLSVTVASAAGAEDPTPSTRGELDDTRVVSTETTITEETFIEDQEVSKRTFTSTGDSGTVAAPDIEALAAKARASSPDEGAVASRSAASRACRKATVTRSAKLEVG